MRITRRIALLAALLIAHHAAAQTLRDTGAVLIRAGTLFDSERGEFIKSQDILVRAGLVVSVGPQGAVPAGSRLIDLSRYTVLPGLIDSHTHLLYLEDPKGSLTTEGLKAVVIEGTVLRALHGAARARTFLAAGITTVRDLGNSGRFGDVALRAAINDGSVDGPRMIVSGPGLSPEGGQFPGMQPEFRAIADGEYRIVRGATDAAAAVRENVTYGATVIKVYSNNSPNPASLSLEELHAIVDEAKNLGVRVAAHATSDAAAWRAAEAGVNSIEHAYSVADSTLALMAKKGVFMVPTDGDSLTLLDYLRIRSAPGAQPSPQQLASMLSSQGERLRRAMAAGVPIASGSDMYIDFHAPQGSVAKRVIYAYVEAGLTPVQALQAATVNAARLLGWMGRVGVIRARGYADIIAVEGDLGRDIRALDNVRFVMKAGTVYMAPR
jgi:imidazolonepropionase-like amidohydrolase